MISTRRSPAAALGRFVRSVGGSLLIPSPRTCFAADGTPCQVDQTIEHEVCAIGSGLVARQTTAAARMVLRGASVNRLLYSSTFSAAAWVKHAALTTIDNAVLGPDGVRIDGCALSWGAVPVGSGLFQQVLATVTGVANSKSIYIRADVAGGTVTIADPSLTSGYTTATLSTEWQRVTLTESAQSSAYGLWLRKTASSPATIYIARAMATIGSSAGDYVATTSAPASTPYGPYYRLLDGIDDCIKLSAPPFGMADDHAVIVACHCTDTSRTRSVSHVAGSAGPSCARLYIYLGGTAVAFWTDDSRSQDTWLTGPVLTGPAVLAARKLGNQVSLWVNGVMRVQATRTFGATTLTGSSIGADVWSSNYFAGMIGAHIAIKGAVSDSQMLLLSRYASLSLPGMPAF